jgi:hypothetical protein
MSGCGAVGSAPARGAGGRRFKPCRPDRVHLELFTIFTMIIGIDDSGNFNTDPLSFFVAVMIRPNKRKGIEKKFRQWERQLPESSKKNSEVKGYLLADNELEEFCRKFLSEVKYIVSAIETSKISIEMVDGQRKRNLKQIEQGIAQYRSQGPDFYGIADQYQEMFKWLKSKSVKTLLKLDLLGIVIFDTLNESIKESAVKGYDRELEKLQFKIDQSFIGKDEHMFFWKDTVRNQIWHLSYVKGGIIHITEWGDSHPFIKKFYKTKGNDEIGMFTNSFKNAMDFYDSADHFEVRMADIVANLYFRKYVQHQTVNMNLTMKANVRFPHEYTLIRMYDGGENIVPNPYEHAKD